jgi:hypothetical protein
MALKKFMEIPAAGAIKGLPVSYSVKVDGKWILTGGTVQDAVKTGENKITLTIKHYQTGEIHTNTLPGNAVIHVHMVALVNQGLVGTLTLWPTPEQRQTVKFAALARWEAFKTAEIVLEAPGF